jgi:hypothetical protein
MRNLVMGIPEGLVVQSERIMTVLYYHPLASTKIKPGSCLSRKGTYLWLTNNNGVVYDGIAWLKCFKLMKKANQSVVSIDRYIREASVPKKRMRDEDAEYPRRNTAALQVAGLIFLKENGIRSVSQTSVDGVVEFTYGGKSITFSLSTRKHRIRGGKWASGTTFM